MKTITGFICSYFYSPTPMYKLMFTKFHQANLINFKIKVWFFLIYYPRIPGWRGLLLIWSMSVSVSFFQILWPLHFWLHLLKDSGFSDLQLQNLVQNLMCFHFQFHIWEIFGKWVALVESKLGQVESVRTLLKITHLATKKSYLVIICPNSHEKFTKIR